MERPIRYTALLDAQGRLCLSFLGSIRVGYHHPLIGRVKQLILKQEIKTTVRDLLRGGIRTNQIIIIIFGNRH